MHFSYNQKILLSNGALWAIYDGLTTSFLIAYAVFLGASNTIIGLLGAIPFLGAIASELPGVALMKHWRRRYIYVACTTLERLMWVFILGIPVLFKENPLLAFVVVYFITRMLGSLADPSWTSLAADVVPERVRGAYFSKRLMLVGLLGMIAFLAGGFILDLFPKESHAGFSVIFSVGIIFGLLATWIMMKTRGPLYYAHGVHTIKDFANSCKGDFGRYVAFSCVFNFAYMLASPFFTVYMLSDLKLSYSVFVIANALGLLAKLFANFAFGPISDRDGDKPIAMLCVFGTALIPFSYLFITQQNLWLLIPAQILSGLCWGGVELTTFNLLLDLTDREDRPFQVAEFQTLTSIPLVASPIIGGLLADNVRFIGLGGIPIVFALSAVLRACSVFFLVNIPERRGPVSVPVWVVAKEFMSVFGPHSVHGHLKAVKRLVIKGKTFL